jgi:hypothetical protein
MSNLKRCNNGHFFDADKYTTCPYCNPTISETEVTVAFDQATMGLDDEDGKTVSLADAISNTAVEIPVSTTPTPAPTDDNKTISYYADTLGAEPCVGWLVCIEGEHYGESFPLKSGRNFVGRNTNMDVSLAGDMSVSRERHAVIIYEPKARIFIAQAGDSKELFYLNDKVVLNNEELKDYDILSVGNERLLFLGLCGPKFCWEDTKKND